MRIFITGASGFVGQAVSRKLLAAGHQVLGLARSDSAQEKVQSIGAEAVRGTLSDIDVLKTAAKACDGVIHLGFNHDFSQFLANCEEDSQAISAFGDALFGTNKCLIVPTGMAGILNDNRVLTENDAVPANFPFPRKSEVAALQVAARGVNASVIRFSQIHDTRRQGIGTFMVEAALRNHQVNYVGTGETRWSACHVDDTANLIVWMMENPERGAVYHAVGEKGVALKDIAEAIGKRLALPVMSISPDEAESLLGPTAPFFSIDQLASSQLTQQRTGWKPVGPSMLEDLANLDISGFEVQG